MGLILKPANSIFGVGAHPGRHLSDLPPKHQFAAEFCWFGAVTGATSWSVSLTTPARRHWVPSRGATPLAA